MQRELSITWDVLHKQLVAFVSQKVKDRSTAEDIVQDVFVKVHTKLDQLREAEKVSSWIYQVTRNAVTDYFRGTARQLAPVNIDWDSNYNAFNDCVAQCLKMLITTLPEKYRVPLELTELQNKGQYEVAEQLNLTYSAARSRVQRARKLLKKKMDELYLITTDRYGNVLHCEDRIPCCCRKDC